MSAASFFTYSVTRQYPAKFTWTIVAGGVVLTTLLTFVAVAGNAYQLETTYTGDYNLTMAKKRWYQREAFAWATDMATACQSALLTIGNDYTTTNQGFHYAISSFRHGDTPAIPLTASYRNGTLSDCQVSEIVIDFTRSNQARLPLNYWTWGSTVAHSTIECTVFTGEGPLKVNFTSQLPPAKWNYEIEHSFLALRNPAHPGRYIGAQLLSAWYTHLTTSMGYSVPWRLGTIVDRDNSSAPSWGSGQVKLVRTDVVDIESMDFFACTVQFQHDDRGLPYMHTPLTLRDCKDQWTSNARAIKDGASRSNLPNISIAVDVFSKTYYSLLLSDFNSSSEVASTNALSTTRGLQYLQTVNDTDLTRALEEFGGDRGVNHPQIDRKFDAESTNLTQPLEFAEYTTIFQQYLCSVPRRKSTFKLLFAVAVADIVLLRTSWTLFGWVATWWLGRKDPTVNHCIGCKHTLATSEIELIHARGPSDESSGNYSRVSSDAEDEHRSHRRPLSAPWISPRHSGA